VNNLGTTQVNVKLLDLLQGDEIETGIPKGIAFSPDGTCLLVTLSETNSVNIYMLDSSMERIIPTPRQILKGISSQLSRPEDIKFTVEGNSFAISNSSKDTITGLVLPQQNC
jgi:sugar lactone lactonase YvrE